jgi:bacillithiol biosynthesis cysteine-adding enzyme BshC
VRPQPCRRSQDDGAAPEPVTTSDLERLLYPSALYRDFLNDFVRVRAFYPRDFRDPAAAVAAARARDYPEARRARTASILTRQAEMWGVLDASRGALARFARHDSVVVVSGQQPALFGGPLYTLYKLLTAVKLAASIEAATGVAAVPVFWIASDDHDFEELRTTYVSDGGADPTPLSYPAEAAPRGVSAARVRFGPAVEALVRSAESVVPPSPFRDPVLSRLRAAYAPGRGFSEAFARFLAPIAAEQGALLFEASDEEAKAAALPIFEREVALGGGSSVAARERGEALEAAGYHAQIARAGNELNLFWHGREREAIRVTDSGSFRLAVSGQELSGSKLLALIRNRPADVSPGVLLRPLMQDHLFPTVAYVGGPAEVAYWAQVYALYPLFDVEPPAVAPRAGATLLEARVARVLERFHLDWGSLAGDPEAAVQAGLRALLPEDFETLFRRERGELETVLGRLKEAVARFDPSLEAAVTTAGNRIEREIEGLEKKLMHVWKRRQEESVLQIRRAHGHLFPRGHLQERTVSLLGYAARYGPPLMERLRASLGEPGSHTLIPLGVSDE